MAWRQAHRLFLAMALIAFSRTPLSETAAASHASPANETSLMVERSAGPAEVRPLSGSALEGACKARADRKQELPSFREIQRNCSLFFLSPGGDHESA